MPQVSLVALGPLTNLAMAVRMDPGFPDRLKDLFIMGGNMEGECEHDITFSLVRFPSTTLAFSSRGKLWTRLSKVIDKGGLKPFRKIENVQTRTTCFFDREG